MKVNHFDDGPAQRLSSSAACGECSKVGLYAVRCTLSAYMNGGDDDEKDTMDGNRFRGWTKPLYALYLVWPGSPVENRDAGAVTSFLLGPRFGSQLLSIEHASCSFQLVVVIHPIHTSCISRMALKDASCRPSRVVYISRSISRLDSVKSQILPQPPKPPCSSRRVEGLDGFVWSTSLGVPCSVPSRVIVILFPSPTNMEIYLADHRLSG